MSNKGIPEKESQLPFDELKERALLGHMLANERLRMQGVRKIDPVWFVDKNSADVWSLVKKVWESKAKATAPSKMELYTSPQWTTLDPKDQHRYTKAIVLAETAVREIRWEYVRDDLTAWMQSKVLERALRQSANFWNDGKWEQTAEIMRKSASSLKDIAFDDGIEVSFEDPEKWLTKAQNEKQHALTTGLTLLDHCLLPGTIYPDEALRTGQNLGGGLQRGDTTIIMAPSNVGKTTCMLTIACHNIMAGKHVLLLTHEGRPEDIRMKLLKAMLGKTERQIFQAYKENNQDVRAIQLVTEMFRKYLTYIPFNKAGMRVEDVAAVIRKAQEDRVASNKAALEEKIKDAEKKLAELEADQYPMASRDAAVRQAHLNLIAAKKAELEALKETEIRGYDLLVNDYPAKLTTDDEGGGMALRTVLDIVYEYFVQLALEYKFHSLLAIQTNREGSKVNTGMNANRLLVMEDVAEAWGPMTSATNVITLNRSANAKRQKRITFYVAKSRSSSTGFAVVAKTDYAHGRTHADSMGAVCYQSELSQDTVCGSWLQDPNKHNKLLDDQGRPIAWPDEEPTEASK